MQIALKTRIDGDKGTQARINDRLGAQARISDG